MGGFLRLRGQIEPPPDIIVNNYTELVAAFGTDLSNKIVLVAGDCVGAEINLTSQTWPGLVLRGSSTGNRPRMPRITSNTVNGAAGIFVPGSGWSLGITFKWLDFYNVATGDSALNSVGHLNWRVNPSNYWNIIECTFRDDPFPTKNVGQQLLISYRNWSTLALGSINHLYMARCESRWTFTGFLKGTDIIVEDMDFQDYYTNCSVFQGSDVVVRRWRCINMWANTDDPGEPHGSLSASFQPDGAASFVGVLMEDCVAVVGTARYDYDGAVPIALGIEFNDMPSGFHYEDIVVRNNLLVGCGLMLGLDKGLNCVIEFNNFVHDTQQNAGRSPSFAMPESTGVIFRGNIVYNYAGDIEAGARLYWNAYADPNEHASDNLIAYDNVFGAAAGAGFISTIEDAEAAFTLNPAHPYSNWDVVPGWRGVGNPLPVITAPVSSNPASQPSAAVNKPLDAALRHQQAGGAWFPSNRRQMTWICKMSKDATMDASTRQVFSFSGNSQQCQWLSSRTWRYGADSALPPLQMISATTSKETTSANGMVCIVLTWDADQAKFQCKWSIGGVIYDDWPLLSFFYDHVWDAPTGTQFTIGNSFGASVPGSLGILGVFDTFLFGSYFVDLDTDAGMSTVFSTANELADLSTLGPNSDVYIHTTAASYNAGTSNTGNGVDVLGNPVTMGKIGTGSFT